MNTAKLKQPVLSASISQSSIYRIYRWCGPTANRGDRNDHADVRRRSWWRASRRAEAPKSHVAPISPQRPAGAAARAIQVRKPFSLPFWRFLPSCVTGAWPVPCEKLALAISKVILCFLFVFVIAWIHARRFTLIVRLCR